jgi:hypothetical protein
MKHDKNKTWGGYFRMDFSAKPLSLYFIMVDFEIHSLISYVYKCILESTYTYGMYNILWKKQ